MQNGRLNKGLNWVLPYKIHRNTEGSFSSKHIIKINSKYMKKIATTLLAQLIALSIWGQTDSSWHVLLLKKGNTIDIKPDMAAFRRQVFICIKLCL